LVGQNGGGFREEEIVGYKEEGESALGLGFADGITERLEKATFDLFFQIDRFQAARRLDEINLAAFGFSRGATEARAFMHWIAGHSKVTRSGSKLKYNGIPLNVKFLGLFDTVESVGWAAANKMPELIKTTVPPYVEKCSHFVASHELRHAFPLTEGDGHTRHIVYPGAHADVGGGYSLQEQGRPNWLARAALMQMLDEARGSGLKMMSLGEMRASPRWNLEFRPSYEIPSQVQSDLSSYLAVTKPTGDMVGHIKAHMAQYWAWIDSGVAQSDIQAKLRTGPDANNTKALRRMSFLLAQLARTPQGRGRELQPASNSYQPPTVINIPPKPEMIAPAAARFFSQYVHDSFEHFSATGGALQTDGSLADYYKLRTINKPSG